MPLNMAKIRAVHRSINNPVVFFIILFIKISATYDVEDDVIVTAEDYAVPVPCTEYCDDSGRWKWSGGVGTSRVLELMLSNPMLQLEPEEPDLISVFRDKYYLPKGIKGPLRQYDFIIIGAGSAGSVLASRLSEDRKTTVLLLEAGREESWFTNVPIMAPFFQQTDYVWPYLMEHQPGVCKGMENERCFWPRGKAVGGSSVINYMIYTRGFKEDWDRIAADGNYGWSYDEVMPYYIKSERANLRGLHDSPWHGRDGELPVEDIPFRSKLSKAFLDAAKLLGHRRVDINSPDSFGFNNIHATMSQGQRYSAAKAFLHKHKKRKTLHILPNSRVTKIIIDPTTNRATGVKFQRNGQIYTIQASKEVILSAGPIESPHILMLSGVGPKQHLKSFSIPVIQDLKVGQTLYDHISYPALTFVANTSRLTLVDKNIAHVYNVMQYNQFGDGPMSSIAGVETIGYIKTNVSDEEGDYPDIELLGTCASLSSDEGNIVARGIHLADWLYKDVYKPLEKLETFTIVLMMLHPKSKGKLRLRSRNPFDQPKLYGNYLTHPKDTATMIAAVRYILKMVGTVPFQKYGSRLYTKKFPNCKQYYFGSDKYWECALRTVTATLHHQIATCKMGPSSDPDAVVDPELRVHGVKNLRVVDSSVIPRTIAAHTNAPAIMIGEKGADLIKKTWAL